MSKDVEEANPSVEDGSLRVLDYRRALCFGRVSLLPPSTKAGISIDDRHECQDAKNSPRIQISAAPVA